MIGQIGHPENAGFDRIESLLPKVPLKNIYGIKYANRIEKLDIGKKDEIRNVTI